MSLQALYERFLATPNPLSLAEHVAFSYVTTLTTIHGAGPVVKHVEAQDRSVVKKKAQKVIGAVEGSQSVSLDLETTLEFISGGGAYLPGLENFVTGKTVTFHTVSGNPTRPPLSVCTSTLTTLSDRITRFTSTQRTRSSVSGSVGIKALSSNLST